MSRTVSPTDKHLLIFAWEYNGYHSVRGTALSKRPRQIAESFLKSGWQVTVIHRDHREESGVQPFFSSVEKSGVHRIAIKAGKDTELLHANPLLRKLETLFYVALRGDRTYKWSADVIKQFDSIPFSSKPTYIFGMFSPRVTLYLGNYFSKKLDIPWIADLQDPIYEGVSRKSWPMLNKWMRSTLRTAHAVSHISPEWAAIDAERLSMPVATIRHAIANPIDLPKVAGEGNKHEFRVFYGGSISADIQSLDLIKQVIENVAKAGVTVKIVLAGNENARGIFSESLGESTIDYKGWLSTDEMNRVIAGCNSTLVVPWSKERIGIPSKFYELCAYAKPIWIAGYDLGAFKSLLEEWAHPPLEIGDVIWQTSAIMKACKGDFNEMFSLPACKGNLLTEADLCSAFERLM